VWGNGDMAPHMLNCGTRWRCVASFTPQPRKEEGAPSTHHKRRCVDPRAGLDTVEKRNTLISAGNLTPDSSVDQLTAQSLQRQNHPDSLYTDNLSTTPRNGLETKSPSQSCNELQNTYKRCVIIKPQPAT
jgi:hypothetical protein